MKTARELVLSSLSSCRDQNVSLSNALSATEAVRSNTTMNLTMIQCREAQIITETKNQEYDTETRIFSRCHL